MRKTLLLSLGVLVLCMAAQAQTYTVTFTLTCDHGASASIGTDPVTIPATDVHLIVYDQNDTRKDCGSATLSCSPDSGRTSTQDCTDIGFVPTRYTTGLDVTNVGVGALKVTSKDGAPGLCTVDNAVPSKNIGCNGSGKNGAALSASKAQ